MSSYQVASGHDNEAGYDDPIQTVFSPLKERPPTSQGVLYPRHITCIDGTSYAKGLPYFIWDWTDITRAEYGEVLAQIGFTLTDPSIESVTCTARTKVELVTPTWANYNCICIHRRGEDATQEGELYRTVRFKFLIVGTT